jgi:hypothetical protein
MILAIRPKASVTLNTFFFDWSCSAAMENQEFWLVLGYIFNLFIGTPRSSAFSLGMGHDFVFVREVQNKSLFMEGAYEILPVMFQRDFFKKFKNFSDCQQLSLMLRLDPW